MKRLLSFLCVLLLLSLCGCNQPEGTFFYDQTTASTVPADKAAPYRTALDTFFNVCYLFDPASLTTVAPAAVWDQFEAGGTVGLDDTKAYLTTNRVYEQSPYLTEVGEHLSYTYTIKSVSPLSADAVTSYATRLQKDYGIATDSVSKATLLSVTAVLKGDLAEQEEELSLTLLYIGDRWYVQDAFDGVLADLSRNALYRR